MEEHPILYSYRRCPFAIRARYTLHYAQIGVEVREISFKDKPKEMLSLSPKGTVPVLQTVDGHVIEESIDIMSWALAQNDVADWRQMVHATLIDQLVAANDNDFKPLLDQYKYFDRAGMTKDAARTQSLWWLERLEAALTTNPYLVSDKFSVADAALFPFIRQYRGVDVDWFVHSHFIKTKAWLNAIVNNERFAAIMQKFTVWQPNSSAQYLLAPGALR